MECKLEEASEEEVKALVEAVNGGAENALRRVREGVRGGGPGAKRWRENGGLAALANRINSPGSGESALLSALADCCLEDDSCKALGRLNIEDGLIKLLNDSKHQTTITAVCRILGNLSRESGNAERLHSKGALVPLIAVIDNKSSALPSLIMAVRAVRLLWSVEKHRDEMVNGGAVKSVAVLLCTECVNANLIKTDEDDTRKENKDLFKKRANLFNGLLKCIGYFSTYPTFQCAEQLIGDGRGYHCLVFLTKKFESFATQCLVNLCYVPPSRPLLGAAGAVKCIIDLLNRQTNWQLTLVKGLSLLCCEAVNRIKIHEYGGLKLLLKIIKDTSHLNRHIYALKGLSLYIFNTDALKYMAKEGLVEILTELLKEYVSTMRCEHTVDGSKDIIVSNAPNKDADDFQCNSSDSESIPEISEDKPKKCVKSKEGFMPDVIPEKRPKYGYSGFDSASTSSRKQSPNLSPNSDYSSASTKTTKSHRNPFMSADFSTLSYYYNNRSPESTSSSFDGHIYITNSNKSPKYSGICYSPSSISQNDNDSSDSEMSGHYSPVCSDNENDDAKSLIDFDLDCLSESNDIPDTVEDEILSGVLKKTQKLEVDEMSARQVHAHRIECLLLLLYQFSRYPKKTVNLTSKDLLFSLINYVERCKHPSKNITVKMLSKIISNPLNFRALLEHSIMLNICNLMQNMKHSKCRQCKQLQAICVRLVSLLNTVAESDYGIGHITSVLLKGDRTVSEKLALTLPYYVKSSKFSKKLYVHCKALDIFINIVGEYKQPLAYSIPALSQLALNLKIRPPSLVFDKFKDFVHVEYDPDCDGSETMFILDDGSTVHANFDLLCQQCDVFDAMLRGSFIEGSQKRVRLQEVTKGGLEYLIVLLQYRAHIDPIESFPMPKSLSVALETLQLADRFILEKLKNSIFSAIIQFKLDASSADKIYIWSLKDGMGTLSMESVAYTLVGEMTNEKRCRIASSILNSIYKDQWLEHIKCSLTRFME